MGGQLHRRDRVGAHHVADRPGRRQGRAADRVGGRLGDEATTRQQQSQSARDHGEGEGTGPVAAGELGWTHAWSDPSDATPDHEVTVPLPVGLDPAPGTGNVASYEECSNWGTPSTSKANSST